MSDSGDPSGMRRFMPQSDPLERSLESYVTRADAARKQMDDLGDILRRKNNPVLDIFDDIGTLVERFQSGLDENHEVGICIAGSISLIHIRSIERSPPSLLVFTGVDGQGNKTVAIQHIAQLNLQLVAVAKIDAKAYRIGFIRLSE